MKNGAHGKTIPNFTGGQHIDKTLGNYSCISFKSLGLQEDVPFKCVHIVSKVTTPVAVDTCAHFTFEGQVLDSASFRTRMR